MSFLVVNIPANINRIAQAKAVMLFGVKFTGLVLSGAINFTRKRKRKQNTTKHLFLGTSIHHNCKMALGILLVTKGTRNANMDSLFCSFIQHLLSPYYVQSTKTQICGDNMAASKKHDLVVVE